MQFCVKSHTYLLVFQSKSWKIGKIVFHQVHSSCKMVKRNIIFILNSHKIWSQLNSKKGQQFEKRYVILLHKIYEYFACLEMKKWLYLPPLKRPFHSCKLQITIFFKYCCTQKMKNNEYEYYNLHFCYKLRTNYNQEYIKIFSEF